MNQKHAREARIVNRIVGTLGKRRDLGINPDTGVSFIPLGGKGHKLPREVKRAHEARNHRERGKITRFWRSKCATYLVMRGIVPKGRNTKPARLDAPSRSERRRRRAALSP